MRRAFASQVSRELESITSSVQAVRILNRTSDTPAPAHELQQLAQARLLARMTRSGLLRVKSTPGGQTESTRHYSITPRGRHLLATATKHLRQFAAPQFVNQKQNTKRQ